VPDKSGKFSPLLVEWLKKIREALEELGIKAR